MMNTEELEMGAEQYGTPLYIYDLDEMRNTAALFREHFKGTADLCFAMKANPFVVRQMAEHMDRIEVCSMGEYRICRALEIPKDKLLISGVLKEKKDILEILEECGGKCMYTIESRNQFYGLANWSEENCEVLQVYLRLTSGNQFGMDEKMIRHLMNECEDHPFLKIRGIHYFSGTQKKSPEKIKKEIAYLDEICRKFENIRELEYGPGIPAAYFRNQKDETEEYFAALSQATADMKWHGKVTLEMGRTLTASCGYYLTQIKDIKNNNEKNYCIVDGGIHQLQYDGQIRGMYSPHIQVIGTQGEEQSWTVCGSLCTVNDILIQDMKGGDLKTGDILVFKRVGAYAAMEGMALFLSHELPAIASFSRQNGWKLIRKKQSTYQWNMEDEN